MSELANKLARVQVILEELERVIVAFSGGVDSTLLAVLARRTLGRDRALAVMADSPSLARHALDAGRELARSLEIDLSIVRTSEADHPDYQANTPLRCYICKGALFQALAPIAAARHAMLVYGAIGDDAPEERPGMRAAEAFAVRAPLHEAGLTKAEVRAAARHMGLPNWDQPQDACLSSRIPHGVRVTTEKLRQIEAAEAVLRRHGFQLVRVRHLGAHARIEVGGEELSRLNDVVLCTRIGEALNALGFESAGVSAYASGGANQHADETILEMSTKV